MAFLTSQSKNPRQRFTLLLLEPGEIYFDDYSVHYYPPGLSDEEALAKKQKGRLKVCSKSIVFDPKDIQCPVLRIPFKHCSSIQQWRGGLSNKLDAKGDVLCVESSLVLQMRENNTTAPYNFKKGPGTHRFLFNYVSLSAVLPELRQLLQCANLPIHEQKEKNAEIVRLHEASMKFDHNWLDSLNEKIVIEMPVEKVNALTTNPGRLVLTNMKLYFQPFNNIDTEPVQRYRLSSIINLVSRRYLLREKGLEFYFDDNTSLFFSFPARTDRDRFVLLLNRQQEVSLQSSNRDNMVQKWRSRQVTNYDYLMYLNSVADRSFNDLTQYPVFPWIIADYTSSVLDLTKPETFRDLSKPIGALTHDRLEMFRTRYQEMPPPKFMYGTHYSTPGFVLFYLVRVAPEYMLCLQNGRFDQPDRLFYDMAATWNNVLHSPTDVKELIPEFYQPGGQFLINSQHLSLGTTQDRRVVNDVILPPWAKDAADFTSKCREALESDYVSAHLHEWIDLIFGYRQRGQDAVRADNVFYYLTYEGAVDLDAVSDPNERAALEMQISEFGQTPKQLFNVPHPRRVVGMGDVPWNLPAPTTTTPSGGDLLIVPASDVDVARPEAVGAHSWKGITELSVLFAQKYHRDKTTGVCLSEDGDTIYSVSADGTLKAIAIADRKQLRSLSVCDLALSSCAPVTGSEIIMVGAWDNNIYLYSMSYGRVVDHWPAHDDAVTCLVLRANLLASASWDASIKLWTDINAARGGRRPALLTDLADHMAEIKCVDISRDGSIIVSGSADGVLIVWSVESDFPLTTVELAHEGGVNGVAFSPDGSEIVSCGADRQLRQWTVDGVDIFTVQKRLEYRCLAYDGQYVVAGTDAGDIHIWDMLCQTLVKDLRAHTAGICSMVVTSDGSCVVTGAEDGSVACYTTPAFKNTNS